MILNIEPSTSALATALTKRGVGVRLLSGANPVLYTPKAGSLQVEYDIIESIPGQQTVTVSIGELRGDISFHIDGVSPQRSGPKSTKYVVRYHIAEQQWSAPFPGFDFSFSYDNDFREQAVISPDEIESYFKSHEINLLYSDKDTVDIVFSDRLSLSKTCKLIPASFTFSVTMSVWNASSQVNVVALLQDAQLASPNGEYRLAYNLVGV